MVKIAEINSARPLNSVKRVECGEFLRPFKLETACGVSVKVLSLAGEEFSLNALSDRKKKI